MRLVILLATCMLCGVALAQTNPPPLSTLRREIVTSTDFSRWLFTNETAVLWRKQLGIVNTTNTITNTAATVWPLAGWGLLSSTNVSGNAVTLSVDPFITNRITYAAGSNMTSTTSGSTVTFHAQIGDSGATLEFDTLPSNDNYFFYTNAIASGKVEYYEILATWYTWDGVTHYISGQKGLIGFTANQSGVVFCSGSGWGSVVGEVGAYPIKGLTDGAGPANQTVFYLEGTGGLSRRWKINIRKVMSFDAVY